MKPSDLTAERTRGNRCWVVATAFVLAGSAISILPVAAEPPAGTGGWELGPFVKHKESALRPVR